MSADPRFRCPVCRASQPLQVTCRRCGADLQLVVRAHHRLAYIQEQLANSESGNNHERLQQLKNELHWLSPTR